MKKVIRDTTKTVEGCELRYVLFEIDGNGRTDYAFHVEQLGGGHDGQMEVDDICETKSEAVMLYDRLVEGCVTPTSLFEIAEDYIFEKTYVNQ